ncbi:hypothetical protein [Alteromonas lipolytica]|uniref:ATP-dependent Clp protease proteolytic subunit n=1 Tax=Alteromonas lipolytica TaxID=1856405 RepID=A0A1E8FCZ6_9ALTE|nr:hypothetical protein [Alteromonas lipolytica]OFI33363.1 hypothetical protein BFC17_03625 [Alteromonas lipolytica]GGF60393.1 hypothetical protein GCM10011338_10770 [Alteromonas lipolytica]
MRVLLLIALFGLVACSSKYSEQTAADRNVYTGVNDGQLLYEGELTFESNDAIFAAYNKASSRFDRLVISSSGGDIGAGMELGTWIKNNNLDVEVASVCASSCANYIFTAANRKYLRKDSVLIWHGSAWQKGWNNEELSETFLTDYLIPMRKKETQLMASLEVDNILTVYGQTKITLWDKFLMLFGINQAGWDYSLNDMKRFGLKNIILVDDEWNWRKYRPGKSKLVKRLKIEDAYAFKLRRFEI